MLLLNFVGLKLINKMEKEKEEDNLILKEEELEFLGLESYSRLSNWLRRVEKKK